MNDARALAEGAAEPAVSVAFTTARAPAKAARTALPAPAASARPASARIDQIDSFRALAMGAVIAQHSRILPFGWMGVWLFFVISGFVVTTSLLERPRGERRASLLFGFYARRAARIWPIYFIYIAVGFLVSASIARHLDWSTLASLAFFYNNALLAFGSGLFKGFPVGHLWTISVEFQFYIVFGLAFTVLSRRALTMLLGAFLLLSPALRFLSGVLLQAAGYAPANAAVAIYVLSPLHFDAFALGALLALNRSQWTRPRQARALFAVGAAAMVVYCAVYVAMNRLHGASGLSMFRCVVSGILFGDQRQVWVYSAVAVISAGLLAMTIAGERILRPIAEARWLQAVGRVSYGGYVYHMASLGIVSPLIRRLMVPGASMTAKLMFGAVRFACAAPLAVGLAFLSYKLIERPIIKAVNKRLAAEATG
jgi:peptidoglycan/LPS O-acetylase OafA/YrhL